MQKAKIYHINRGGHLITVKAYSKTQIAKELNMTLYNVNYDCNESSCDDFSGEITHDLTKKILAIKPLSKKQKKIIVASFIGQIIDATDGYMFGDSPEEYILGSDEEDILNMIKDEAKKYLMKVGSFGNIGNTKDLIKAVIKDVK